MKNKIWRTSDESDRLIIELTEACQESLVLFKHFNKSSRDFLAVELLEKVIKKAEGK